ncbi:MAG: hypothetical protein NC452_08295 [Eubacterium sp.]|nr:hypothetical protein [Eubacterium sp.]
MEKIIVEIKCPAASKSYEFRISKKLSVDEGMKKIILEIRGFEHNEAMFSDDISIFKAGTILNKDMTFSENGVKSGDVLMII